MELGNELISRRGELIFALARDFVGGVFRVLGVRFRVLGGSFRVLGGVNHLQQEPSAVNTGFGLPTTRKIFLNAVEVAARPRSHPKLVCTALCFMFKILSFAHLLIKNVQRPGFQRGHQS